MVLPGRVRQVPRQFSWIDHRLVRERFIDRCDAPAAALYLFLVTVGDAQGVSSDFLISEDFSLAPLHQRVGHSCAGIRVTESTL